MSKTDWQTVASRHDLEPDQDFPEWLQAIEELRSSEDSRELAVETDPLLMFQALPAGDSSEYEIAAMKDAVSQMRRVGDLPMREHAPGRRGGFTAIREWLLGRAEALSHGAWRLPAGAGRWQAAAILTLVVAAAWVGQPWFSSLDEPAVQAAVTAAPAMIDNFSKTVGTPWVPADLHHQPLVEDAGPGSGELIQIEDAEVSLVVVLPGSSDSEV